MSVFPYSCTTFVHSSSDKDISDTQKFEVMSLLDYPASYSQYIVKQNLQNLELSPALTEPSHHLLY